MRLFFVTSATFLVLVLHHKTATAQKGKGKSCTTPWGSWGPCRPLGCRGRIAKHPTCRPIPCGGCPAESRRSRLCPSPPPGPPNPPVRVFDYGSCPAMGLNTRKCVRTQDWPTQVVKAGFNKRGRRIHYIKDRQCCLRYTVFPPIKVSSRACWRPRVRGWRNSPNIP